MARLDHRPWSWRDDPAVPELPDERIVLVVDGQCALCAWGARTIARNDPEDHFRITTIQSDTGRALLSHFGLDPDDPCSWLALLDGCALTASDAVVAVGKRLSGPWKALARLAGVLPRPVRDGLYRLIARYRKAWFGRADLRASADEALEKRLF